LFSKKIFNKIVACSEEIMNFENIKNLLIENQYYIPAGVFLLCFLIQLIYYLGIYSRFVFYKGKSLPKPDEPVSVIICARNEAENLEKYLPIVLTQNYKDYEVIVVDDGSSDETEYVLKRLQMQFSHLRYTKIHEDKKFTHGKKLAVTLGIKAAKHDILVFTDADCKPVSNLWLQKMAENFTEGKELVLGYGGFYPRRGLLNKYIRFDTLIIAMQYFGYAICGFPYMGVGRNIAYRKSFFYKTAGFSNHLHLLSGDDDLFVNENATRKNTAVEFSKESHTRSDPQPSLKMWLQQKKRHLTTAPLYKFKHKILLTLETFSRFLFYFLFVFLLFFPDIRLYVLAIFTFRLLIQFLIIKKAMIRLKENNLLLYSFIFDFFSLFINFWLFVSNRIRHRHHTWK
jgi:cellulose synthase/poly-beta-1,6-N-acetylglucosamine synthase-like glycosyltransferase